MITDYHNSFTNRPGCKIAITKWLNIPPLQTSLRSNCGPWKLKDILLRCWKCKTNSTLILLVSGNYCIFRWL